MSATSDFLNFFTEPAVALLYFLSVILLSQAALFMALGQRFRGRREAAATRYALASFGVMIAWLSLMGGAIFALVTGRPTGTILPPLDRAVMAMVALLAGWAFLTAQSPARRLDDQNTEPGSTVWLTALVVMLALGVIGGYAYTASQWLGGKGGEFNLSSYNTAWIFAIAAITGFMLLLLLLRFRATVDAPLKMIFFVFVLAGCLYTLYSLNSGILHGDDAGGMRLAFLAAMPFLPIAVYRLIVDRLMSSADARVQAIQQVIQTQGTSAPAGESAQEREAVSILKALGMMIDEESPEAIPQQIAKAVALALKADIAALLVTDDAEYADVIAAFDNIQQKPIAAMALKLDEQPTLVDSILNKSQRALNTERNLNELVDLYTRLDIQKPGPTYFQPLSREGGAVGALVVGLPYTQRDLRSNETALLEGLAPVASRLVAISRSAQRAKVESQDRAVQAIVEGTEVEVPANSARAEQQASLEVARHQINELSAMVRDLQIELDYERGRITNLSVSDPEGLSITQRMTRMSEERAQLEAEREKLTRALQEAQTQLATASGSDDEVLQTMVGVLQKEREELQTQKAQLETQLTEIRSRGNGATPAVLREMLTNLSEEKARLAIERDQIKQQLSEVEAQLQGLGIEGGSVGLTTMFFKLTDERSHFKALAERAIQERDTLLTERKRIADQIAKESQREGQITAMETELRRLAEDREALLRQRDSLRNERGSANADREKWEMQRAKMVADMAALSTDLEEAVFERNRTIAKLNKLAGERTQIQAERDRYLAEHTALQTERDQLAARVEGNRELLQQLGSDGVGALKTMIDDLTLERSDLQEQLLQAQNMAESLQEALEDAQGKLAHSVQVPPSVAMNVSDAEVMLSIAQELRTPASSIVGYVDLLLGESVGILGALQRQFLQRVKANVDRLTTLLEDFIRVTALDTGQLALEPGDVDMIEIIDDAITSTREQFREKGITLKMDIPAQLPPLHGDRDALQQVVVQLLSNAYLASPTDGEVSLQARLEREHTFPLQGIRGKITADAITLAVRDQGGGIPVDEQARVFSRLYRADNPLIQGLGDTGVGLSIARALVEAHGGHIGLESTPGAGSIFKLAIPLVGAAARQNTTENVQNGAS